MFYKAAKWAVFYIIIASFLGSYSHASDMRQYLNGVLDTHPSILASLKNITRQHDEYDISFRDYEPDITLNLGIAGQRSNNTGGATSINKDTQQYSTKTSSLALAQNIYSFGGTEAQIAEAKLQIGIAEVGFYITERDILLNAIEAYINYFKAKAIVTINEKNLKSVEESLLATEERQQVGRATITDVAQAKARYASSKAEYHIAQNTVKQAESQFNQLFNFIPNSDENPLPEPKLYLPKQLIDFEYLWQQADKHNMSLHEARLNLDNIQAAKNSRLRSFLPSLDLNASISRQHSTNKFQADIVDNSQIGLNLSIPLYQQGVVHASLDAFNEAYSAAQQTLRNTIRLLKNTLNIEIINYHNANSQVDAYKQASNAAALALSGLREEQYQGRRTVLDVLDGEQELLNAEVNLTNAEYDILLAQYKIYALSGHLTPSNLDLQSRYVSDMDTTYKRHSLQDIYDMFQ